MTCTRQRIATASKNNKAYYATTTAGETSPLFQFDSLSQAGIIRIVGHGSENVYFEWTDDNGFKQNGFCKCL